MRQCPKCGKENVAMTGGWASSREFAGLKASYERQYKCPDCGNQWNTIEVPEADLVALDTEIDELIAELKGFREEVNAALAEDEITYREEK